MPPAPTAGSRRRSANPDDVAEIRALYETTQELCSQLDLDQVLQAIVGRASELLNGDVAYLAVTDDASQALRMRASVDVRTDRFRQLNMQYGVGLGGAVAAQRRPISTTDYIADGLIDHASYIDEIVAAEGLKAAVGVPVEFEHTLLAILFVAKRRKARFSARQITLLSSLANSAAIAMHNARVHARLGSAMSIHTRLLELSVSGRGAQVLVETLAEMISGPVLLLDGSAQRLAAGGPPGELESPGRAALESATGAKPAGADGDLIGCLVRPITLGDGRVEGYLLARPGRGDQAAQELHQVAVEQAGTIIALEMARIRSVENAELSRRADLLDELLKDPIRDSATLVRQSARLGLDLTVPHVVGVVRLAERDEPSEEGAGVRRWRPLVPLLPPPTAAGQILAIVRATDLVLLIPASTVGEAEAAARSLLGEAGRAGLAAFTVGLGRVCRRPSDYRLGHAEAVKAVEVGRSSPRREPVVAFASLHFHQLVLGASPGPEIVDLATRVLASLAGYDERTRHGSLIETLAVFLIACGNLEATARRLGVHVNTLRGRLKRIEALTGRDLQNAADRLDLHLALSALSIL